MSAIFGVLRFDGADAATRDLERMGNTLAFRGPDGRGLFTNGPVGLGHGLLRVTHEDAYEAQPLSDREAGVTLVADLRLDNREELAETFKIGADDLHTMPDSALVLRAYKRWGEDCAQHLLGDFAFALWDGRAQRLVLARDHMGQRYVHYHVGADYFVFATEIKALWAYPDVPRVLSEPMIGSLLMRERPPEGRKGQTLFDGIQALSGATVMSVGRDKTIRQQRYWEPLADPAHKGRDEAYYIDAYRRVLGEAVACRIRRTTRPPGLIFSGGYDSAAIAGLAGPVLAATKQRLVAATSAMPADYRGGIPHARPWVEMCARHMPHLDVHYVTREGRDALSGLDRVFAETQRPTGLQHYVSDELLMCLAQGGARLIMDGHGGDQTLNPRGQKALAHFLVTGQFRRFAAELPAHLRATRLSRWATFRKDLLSPLLPKALKRLKRRARRRGAPAWHGLPINPAFAARLVAGGAIDSSNLHTELTYGIDMHAQMLTVLRRRSTDGGGGIAWRAASRGLELTRPFYDKRVVELALAIPQDLYVKNGRNRYLACAALKDVYPREFQARSRQNDDRIPDFEEMTKAIEPQLVAEVARMEKSEALSRYVDFAAVRRLLAARGADDRKPGWEVPMLNALHGILFARYIEWFEGHNR